jgi:hydroxyacylglutathione hydrolase
MLTLIPIPAFADNYLWMLHDGKRALVVDPGDAAPVSRYLKEHALQLEAILVTHHHADHTGGVDELREATGAKVYGPAAERIPEPYEPLREGDSVTAMGLAFQVIEVPGHTLGHLHCSFAATRFFQVAVADCLKARPHKCWPHSTNWLPCLVTPASAAPMSTP